MSVKQGNNYEYRYPPGYEDTKLKNLYVRFVFLIPVERRNHLWDLLHTTAGGRGKLFFLRFLTMLPTVLFTMTAAYLPSFLYLSSLYGLPDLGICAQSEEVFSELAYPLSLGSFLAVLLSVRPALCFFLNICFTG